jgi:hypothetical protein
MRIRLKQKRLAQISIVVAVLASVFAMIPINRVWALSSGGAGAQGPAGPARRGRRGRQEVRGLLDHPAQRAVLVRLEVREPLVPPAYRLEVS